LAVWLDSFERLHPQQNLGQDGYERTSPVMALPPNGLHDMIGNVREWTTDWWSSKHQPDAPKACCILENPRGGPEDRRYDPHQPNIKFRARSSRAGRICARQTPPRGTGGHVHKPRWISMHSAREEQHTMSTKNDAENKSAPNRRQILLAGTTAAAASAIGTSGTTQVAQAQAPAALQQGKPNILFILMDNLGYGELGVYGGGILRGAPTPRLDQLASEGTRLTNFNVEAQCTPSRSAIMTGRFSIRSGTHTVPIGGGLDGLTQWEVTIAETLSAVGYATGHFGKWHLGSIQGRLPNDQGFDEWYGIPRTTDEAFWPSDAQAKAANTPLTHLMEGRKGQPSRELAIYDLERRRETDEEITRRAIDFMRRNVAAGKPFYAYVPYTQVHFPALPNRRFAGKTGYGDFPDCLAEMDANVGELLDAVDSLGIRNNTIVVFTSDNGPDHNWPWQGSSGPWRGYYFTHMEGSLRTPFIIRWPGSVPAGRVSNEIVHEVDTFTTLAKMAGAAVPQDRAIDGVDQRSGEVAELENDILRRTAGLVEPANQARRAKAVRSYHRSERGIPAEQHSQHMGRRAGHENRGGVRGKLEDIPADCARHA
jgi:arylsulfatase